MRQFTKFKNRKIQFMKSLSENLYFRNLDNDAGVFHHLLDAAEEEEGKEAVLAYHFLRTAGAPLTAGSWTGGSRTGSPGAGRPTLDFEVDDGVGKLRRLRLVDDDGQGRLTAVPLDEAKRRLDETWDDLFTYHARRAAGVQPRGNGPGQVRIRRRGTSDQACGTARADERRGDDAEPTTLRALEGMPAEPVALADSTLIMIDLQNTYTRGVMELENVQSAVDQAAELLDRARSAGTPVIHIVHDGGAGSPYDVHDAIGQIVDRVAPRAGEPVIVKNFPNAFTATDLDERLAPGSNLVLAGFMTHMCVSSTARGAFSLGHHPAVVASTTATRALPGTDG